MADLDVELAEYLDILGLQVQAVWQEEDLVVVFNRLEDEHLDYPQLIKKTISKLHQLKVRPPKSIIFYARKLGEEEPDWQKTVTVKLKESPPTLPKEDPIEEKPPDVVAPSIPEETTEQSDLDKPPDLINPSTAEPEQDIPTPSSPPPKLSDFCFTRNKALVKADLPFPDRKVAENVQFFHELSERTQLELAPILEDFFKNPDKTSLVSVPAELRPWFEDLKKLKDAEFKSQAIWLSRYCYDREKTMNTINQLFASLAEKEEAKQQVYEPTPPPVQIQSQARQRSVKYSSNQPISQTSSRGSQRFTPDELVFMIGGSLLIGGIGWFLWGTASALGVIGWIAAIASVGSGVGGVVGNQGLKTISGIVLFIIFLLFFLIPFVGLIFLWIEFLGWLIGLVWGGAVKTIATSSGAPTLTSPKPLRLSIVFFIVILIGIGYAISTSSAKMASQNPAPNVDISSPPLSQVEVTITDTSITMSNVALKNPFAMEIKNQSSKTCVVAFELVEGGIFSYNASENPIIPSKQSKTINFVISATGPVRLECEGSPSEPNLLQLTGPVFTVKDH
jgi:hypothetical protein